MTEVEEKEITEEERDFEPFDDESIDKYINMCKEDTSTKEYKECFKSDDILVKSKISAAGSLHCLSTLRVRGVKSVDCVKFSLDGKDGGVYGENGRDADQMYFAKIVLRKVAEHQWLMAYQTKQLVRFILSARDFVYLMLKKELEGDRLVIINQSVETKIYPEKKGVVRGVMHYTVFYSEPHPDDKNDVLITYVANIDGRGWVPRWLMNFLTVRFAPNFIKKLRSSIVEYFEDRDGGVKKDETDDENEEEEEGEDESEDDCSDDDD